MAVSGRVIIHDKRQVAVFYCCVIVMSTDGKNIKIGLLALAFIFWAQPASAAKKKEPALVSQPVIMQSEKPAVDEKGTKVSSRPEYFNVFLGSQMLLADATGAAAARSFANANMLRSDEIIYKGSGATISDATGQITYAPAIRLEWELPFERVRFLPSWRIFSLLMSFDAAYSPDKPVLSSAGNFRYQNAQAQHVALTDLTYTGTLTATERHYGLSPMLGVQIELTNATMQGWRNLSVLLRAAGGVTLQTGQQNYELALNPQYVSAGAYSDNYVIKSSVTQAYSMAFLAVGRADLGVRFRLSGRLHLIVMGSAIFSYGFLPYDNYGIFQEQAGQNKNIYQKVVSGTADQEYMGIAPAFFLALSSAI